MKTREEEITERELSGQLFGSIKKLEPTGGHQPTLRQLRDLRTLKSSDYGVAKTFCTGCGTILCIIQAGAQALAKRVGAIIPEDLKKYYFQVSRCLACSDAFQNPELKYL